jgi:DNA-binding transcriptional ArsR family regulator
LPDDQSFIYFLIEFVAENHINRNIAIDMGKAKTDEFTVRDVRIARYAKALAHPARVAILQILLRRNSCVCGAFVEELPLSQSTVSQHLKELKEAGLIRGDIDGTSVCYCIDQAEWEKAKETMSSVFAIPLTKKGNNCC